MNKIVNLGVAFVCVLSLGACGGGSKSSSSTASAASAPASAASTAASASAGASSPAAAASAAAGLWTGSTTDNRSYAQLVLGSGDYYLFYSPIGDTNSVGGAMFGTGTVSGTTYAAPNGHVFDIQTSGVQTTTLTATVVAKTSLNGYYTSTANSAVPIISFAGVYDATSDTAPKLVDLSGTYTGDDGTNAGVQQGATLTVGADGSVIVNAANNCSASGTAKPRTDGNAFDLTLKFGATCALANQSVTGIAYNNLAARRLYTLTPTADRSDFFLFVGGKN